MNLSPSDIAVLRDIIGDTQSMLEKKKGYSVCNSKYLADAGLVHVLSLARHLTRTTYLMMRCCTSSPTLFVHFTSAKNAESIKANGFHTQSEENGNESDFYDALCCFRFDAMSRGFRAGEIDTAVMFKYTGEYLSCIRQEDSNSNIGYQIIEDLSGVSCISTMSWSEFDKFKSYSELDYKSILFHHGLSIKYEYRLANCRYSDLSTVLPALYTEVVEDCKEETSEF